MSKYEKYIVRKPLILEELPAHPKGHYPVFMGMEVVPETKVTIHGHWRNKKTAPPPPDAPTLEPHTHDVDQIYLCLAEPGATEVEVTLGDEKHRVESPYAIYVPAGVVHAIRNTKGIEKPPIASAMILLRPNYGKEYISGKGWRGLV